MKVLYIRSLARFNLVSGGSVGHTSGVINAFAKQIEIQVISNDKLPGVKIPIRIINPFLKFLPFIGEFLFNIRLILTLKGISEFDLIYQRHTTESFISAYYSKKYKIPFVLEYNGSEVWTLQKWYKEHPAWLNALIKVYRNIFKIPTAKFVENYNLKHSDIIVVVSKVLKNNLIKRGINGDKILVNPNGVDVDIYHPNVDVKKLKEDLDISNKTVFGFIGTYGPWHGGLVLAEAINLFYDKNPKLLSETVFLLIGDGNQLPEVKNIIKQQYKQKSVIFTGKIEQNLGPKYLSCCDVFLSPHVPNVDGTEFFGSPTKLFEYMAIGRPIIASNLNQIGKIIQDNKTGILLEPGNVSEIVNALEKLVSDHALRNRLGKAAREEVVNQYSWDIHINKLIHFINENEQA